VRRSMGKISRGKVRTARSGKCLSGQAVEQRAGTQAVPPSADYLVPMAIIESSQDAQERVDAVHGLSTTRAEEAAQVLEKVIQAERKALTEVLERVQWNRAEAARLLKISYKTLLNKISECRLSPPARPL
jgi:DNA-binding NtrC family response regulator